MSSDIRSTAGIAFGQRVMRYAEVERSGESVRLVRLGNCDFEFDAARELFASARPSRLDVIQEALRDVFSGTTAESVRLVLPGNILTSFRTVVPVDASDTVRNRQIAFEARTVVGEDAEGDLFPSPGHVAAEESLMPVFVSHAPNHVAERMRTIGGVFSGAAVELVPRPVAVHNAVNAIQAVTGARATLVVGAYGEHTEYQVIRDGHRVADASYRVHSATDRVYFSLEFLVRHGISTATIDAVWLHGDAVDGAVLDGMHTTWGERAALANPGPAVRLEEGKLDADFGFEAFLATIGAAVR